METTRSTAIPQPPFCFLKWEGASWDVYKGNRFTLSLFFLHLTVSHLSSFTKMTNLFMCFHKCNYKSSTGAGALAVHFIRVLFGFYTCSTIIVWLFPGRRMNLAIIKGNWSSLRKREMCVCVGRDWLALYRQEVEVAGATFYLPNWRGCQGDVMLDRSVLFNPAVIFTARVLILLFWVVRCSFPLKKGSVWSVFQTTQKYHLKVKLVYHFKNYC